MWGTLSLFIYEWRLEEMSRDKGLKDRDLWKKKYLYIAV